MSNSKRASVASLLYREVGIRPYGSGNNRRDSCLIVDAGSGSAVSSFKKSSRKSEEKLEKPFVFAKKARASGTLILI